MEDDVAVEFDGTTVRAPRASGGSGCLQKKGIRASVGLLVVGDKDQLARRSLGPSTGQAATGPLNKSPPSVSLSQRPFYVPSTTRCRCLSYPGVMSGKPGGSAPQAPRLLKRKQPLHPDLAHRKRRRVEAQDARVISAQTTGKAFGDGEVDVEKFVRAREFEIKALEDAMKKSKKGLSSRAFQNVPKDLRRRTASHNAKRVPKRLRSRAVREVNSLCVTIYYIMLMLLTWR